jgi:hypothetical protein
MPTQVGVIQCPLPEVERAVELTLNVTLAESGRKVSNHWPVWVYPRLGAPPQELGIVDPPGLLSGFGDWLKTVPRFSSSAVPTGYPVLLTTGLEENLWRWIERGGRALLLQQGDGPLPARRCPFWREAIKLFSDHPLWGSFPQRGYADLQFFGLAGDLAFDSASLPAALHPGSTIHPILRRLDARAFHMSEYIFEARVGEGVLLACALPLQGGKGAQPEGWMRNVAGAAMLRDFLKYLAD